MSREMKESALPWVGNIPSNWRLGRIKHIYSVTLGKMISPLQTESEQTLENYLCAANIKWSGVDNSVHKQMWFNKSEKEQYLLEDGDVLIMEGGTVGTTTIYHNEFSPCYIQNSVHKCRGKDMIANKFLYYWMQVVQSSGYIDTVCNKATIQHYTKDKVKETPCILVPEDEQHAIVRYLDAKCAAIDEAIERHKKIIEKLEEYQKSEITRITTKGIYDTEYKESCIDIVGPIPVSWSLKRLKYLCDITTGDSDTQDRDPDGAYPFYVRSPIVERSNHVTFDGESILMAGDGAGAGRIFHLAHGKYAVHQRVYRLYNIKKITPEFLLAFLSVKFPDRMDQGSAMSTVPSVRLPMLKDFVVPVPPLNEQEDIVRSIKLLRLKIEDATQTHEGIISKLDEYRKSIIYNAVTGKIDCREAVK